MRYHYTNVQPEGGFDRKTKYRNPEYFDGNPERDATFVLVADGYTPVVEAYKKAGVAVCFDTEESPLLAASVGPQEPGPVGNEVDGDDATAGEGSIEYLRAQYEQRFGKKPGRMNKDTIIAALEEG